MSNLTEIPAGAVDTDATLGPVKVGYGLMVDQNGFLHNKLTGGGGGGDPVNSNDSVVFSVFGTVMPTTGLSRWYPPKNVHLNKVYFSLESAGTDDTVLRLNHNGTQVGGEIRCLAGAYRSNNVVLDIALTTNDYITVDVTDGTTGKNVTAVVVFDSVADIPMASATVAGVVKLSASFQILDGKLELSDAILAKLAALP